MPLSRLSGSRSFWMVNCIVLAMLCGCSRDSAPATEAAAKSKAIPVKTVAVVQEDVRRTSLQPATVHPYYRAEIRAKVSGYVGKVLADIGDVVEEGATLAVIDVPEMAKQRQVLEARIVRHQSEEKRATAGVDLATANVKSAEANLSQVKSEMSKADASLAAVEAEFKRTNDLVERQSLERRMLDEVRKKRDSEIANKQAAASAIQSAQAQVVVAEAKRVSARADLDAAKADTLIAKRQLEELDVLVGYATLKAPFAGLVTERTADPGNLVRESSEVGKGQPLFVISHVSKVRVHIPIPEADAPLVNRGDAVTLRFPSFPADQPLEAKVTRVTGDLDPSTRTMLVEAEIDNQNNKLMPGMFGEASIALTTHVAANMLPARAIRFSETGEAYVYVVGTDQTVTVTPITTGLDNGHSIEVKEGVEAGQQVIDAHLKRFETGQKVMLVRN